MTQKDNTKSTSYDQKLKSSNEDNINPTLQDNKLESLNENYHRGGFMIKTSDDFENIIQERKIYYIEKNERMFERKNQRKLDIKYKSVTKNNFDK